MEDEDILSGNINEPESKKGKSSKKKDKSSEPKYLKKWHDVTAKEKSRAFLRTVGYTLEKEGVFSDHEHDSGGKTKFGITENLAKDVGYNGDIVDLTKEEALSIYNYVFWNEWLQKIYAEYYPLAVELFDTAVLHGEKDSYTFLQKALNIFNRSEKDYKDLKVDGVIGNKTFSAIMEFKSKRHNKGLLVLANAINCLQGADIVSITESNELNESFAYGWFLNRVVEQKID